MTAATPYRSASPPSSEPDVISLLAIANMVLRHRFLVVGTALLAALLVGVPILLIPRTFTAESSFVLQSRPSLPGNLSGLASQFGLTLPTGEANQTPLFYAELLQSREILGAVVDSPLTVQRGTATNQAALAELLRVRGSAPALQRDNTIRRLRNSVGVSTSARTGIVTLKVTTRSPELSAAIGKRMLSLLNDFNLRTRQSQASAERRFTESRLQEAERQLREAEDRLLSFTQRNRVTTSPLLTLEQDRLQREVNMRQQVYTSVMQAYDRAKIEEVRDTPVITVLQPPEEPVRPDRRGLVVKVMLTFIVALVFGMWLASLRDALRPRPALSLAPLAEFSALMSDVRDDLRHPLRTLGRLVRFGKMAGGREAVSSPA